MLQSEPADQTLRILNLYCCAGCFIRAFGGLLLCYGGYLADLHGNIVDLFQDLLQRGLKLGRLGCPIVQCPALLSPWS
jgi:hypothetical protein